MGDQVLRNRRGRISFLAAVVLLPAGALGIRNRMLNSVPVQKDNIQGLMERLKLAGDDSLAAQCELEKRVGSKNLQPWKRVLNSTSSHARYLAADAIANTHSVEGGAILAGLLKDYASQVRTCAVESLGAWHYKESIPVLITALADDDTWVRESAASQLVIRSDPRTVPALMAAIHDGDKVTANQVIWTLCKITHKPYRSSFRDDKARFDATIAKWDAWWTTAEKSWIVESELKSIKPMRPELVGPIAWDFSVETISKNNRRFRLSDQKGKVVLLNFFSSQCGPCGIESQDIQKVYEEFAGKGLEIIALEISADSPKTVQAFSDRMKIGYPVALASMRTVDDYGHIHDVPDTFLLDRSGRIRYQWDGQRDYHTFAAGVRRLLAEEQ